MVIHLGAVAYWARIVTRIADGGGDKDFTLADALGGLRSALEGVDDARGIKPIRDP
jgi:hypothetical protein